jgi:hypothetical protein
VVPSANHQPCLDREVEAQFSTTAYREFYEELLGGKDAHGEGHLEHDFYFRHKEMRWFRKHEGAFKMLCTSIGTNLIHGTVGASILLAIHDTWSWKKYWTHIHPNWEQDPSGFQVVSTRDPAGIRDLLTNPRLAGSALVCLIEGLLTLQRIDEERVALPAISRIQNPSKAHSAL